MRVSFWRRKNARLDSRLSNLVQSSERTRKTSRRKPLRVQIDTTYVDQATEYGADHLHDPAEYDNDQYESVAGIDAEPETAIALTDGEADQPGMTVPDVTVVCPNPDETDGHDDVLREAIAQLDQAEAREERALREVEAQRTLLETLRNDIERERLARIEAEAALAGRDQQLSLIVAAPAAQPDPEPDPEKDALLASLEAELSAANTERTKRDAAHDQTRLQLQAAEAQLGTYKSAAVATEALRDELQQARDEQEAMRQVAEKQQVRLAELTSEIAREQAARAAAEASAREAQVAIEAATAERRDMEAALLAAHTVKSVTSEQQSQLAALATNVADLEAREKQAIERHAEAEARAEKAEAACAELEQRCAAALENASDADRKRRASEQKAAVLTAELEAAMGELAQIKLAVEKNAGLEQTAAAAVTRATKAESQLAEQHNLANRQARDIEQLRIARHQAEAAAEAATEELAGLRKAAAQSELAERRRTESQLREEAQRQDADDLRLKLTELEAELQAVRTTLTDVQADREAVVQRATTTAEELAELRRSVQSPEPPQDDVHNHTEDQAPTTMVPMTEMASAEPDGDVTAFKPSTPADEQVILAAEPPAASVIAKRPQRILASPEQQQTSIPDEAAARVPANSAPAPAAVSGSLIENRIAMATVAKQRSKDNRRAKRVASRKLASLWNDKMSAALSCTMLDRSSTGAKLEVLEDRYNDRMNDIRIGDRFTVSLNYAQETTSIDCEVMWVSGRRCGVRFCGQIVTKANKPAKRALPQKELEKPTTGTSIKSLFGVGAR